MKILTVNRNYFMTGGPEKYFFSLEEEMSDCDFIPFSLSFDKNRPSPYSRFFVSNPNSGSSHRFDNTSFSLTAKINYALNSIYSFESKAKLSKLIQYAKPDVAFFLNAVFFSQSIIDACRRNHIPIVWRLSDFNMICGNYLLFRNESVCTKCVGGSLRNILIHKCGGYQKSLMAALVRYLGMSLSKFRGAYRHVNYFVCPSSFTRSLLIQAGFPESKCIQIPTFIRTQDISEFKTNSKTILFIGRFSPEKGVSILLQSLKYLKSKDFYLELIGYDNSDHAKALLEQIPESIKSRVIVHNFMEPERLKPKIARSACVVVPSVWYENLPNVVLEAMAFGKPVIASRLGSLIDTVHDGQTGLLFEAGNCRDLASKIDFLLSNPDQILAYGENAYNYITERHNVSRHTEALKAIFNKAMQESVQ